MEAKVEHGIRQSEKQRKNVQACNALLFAEMIAYNNDCADDGNYNTDRP